MKTGRKRKFEKMLSSIMLEYRNDREIAAKLFLRDNIEYHMYGLAIEEAKRKRDNRIALAREG